MDLQSHNHAQKSFLVQVCFELRPEEYVTKLVTVKTGWSTIFSDSEKYIHLSFYGCTHNARDDQ